MNLNETQLMQEALEIMANVLHCDQNSIIDALVGVLLTEEDAEELRFSLL